MREAHSTRFDRTKPSWEGSRSASHVNAWWYAWQDDSCLECVASNVCAIDTMVEASLVAERPAQATVVGGPHSFVSQDRTLVSGMALGRGSSVLSLISKE